MSPASDPSLSDRIRTGDLDAFETLFRRLQPSLLRLACTLRATPAEAEDVVQETFVRLWERRDRIDPEQSLRAYLARTVRNRVYNAVRDARTRRTLLATHADDLVPPEAPEAPPEALATRLRALLGELPERQRVALTLTRFDGFSHAEAAEAMGCAPRTVNNHIVRGLRTLRERLDATDSHVR